MACNCWAVPQPIEHNYLLTLEEKSTHRTGRCIMRSTCPHGFQEYATELAAAGELVVVDQLTDEKFAIVNPLVVKVDARAAAHVPVSVADGEEVTL
jgi:hypothetical protein